LRHTPELIKIYTQDYGSGADNADGQQTPGMTILQSIQDGIQFCDNARPLLEHFDKSRPALKLLDAKEEAETKLGFTLPAILFETALDRYIDELYRNQSYISLQMALTDKAPPDGIRLAIWRIPEAKRAAYQVDIVVKHSVEILREEDKKAQFTDYFAAIVGKDNLLWLKDDSFRTEMTEIAKVSWPYDRKNTIEVVKATTV